MKQSLVILLVSVLLFSCRGKEKAAVEIPATPKDSLPEATNDAALNAYAGIDVSPMDMSYFPVDYPKLKMGNNKIAAPVMRVIYSRPHLGGRQLFHDVLKYGDRWRLGANEATEVDFYRDVTIQNKKVKPGRYVIYAVLGPDKWTIVLNSNIDSWGLQQDTTKDVERFDVHVTHGNPPLEYFTMVFEKTDIGADLVMAWDDVMARLPINF